MYDPCVSYSSGTFCANLYRTNCKFSLSEQEMVSSFCILGRFEIANFCTKAWLSCIHAMCFIFQWDLFARTYIGRTSHFHCLNGTFQPHLPNRHWYPLAGFWNSTSKHSSEMDGQHRAQRTYRVRGLSGRDRDGVAGKLRAGDMVLDLVSCGASGVMIFFSPSVVS